MNIEIANRLVNLRKSNNLSQEALAEKLGISRQAVSKWERAEASPDTDNLILLARLYKVSLDELLKTDDEIPILEDTGVQDIDGSEGGAPGDAGFETGYSQTEETFDNGSNKDEDDERHGYVYYLPMTMIIVIVYFLIGCLFGAWHPGWLLFLLIPIWHSLVSAIRWKSANYFAYPVLAALIYLCLGFYWFAWHPGWIIFLTIPLYYSMVSYIHVLKRRQGRYGRKSILNNGKDGEADEE